MKKELDYKVAEYGRFFDDSINCDRFMNVISAEGLIAQEKFLKSIVAKTTRIVEAKKLLDENIKALGAFVVKKGNKVPVKRLNATRHDRPRDLGKLVCQTTRSVGKNKNLTNLSKESRAILDKLIKTPFTSALNYKLQTS